MHVPDVDASTMHVVPGVAGPVAAQSPAVHISVPLHVMWSSQFAGAGATHERVQELLQPSSGFVLPSSQYSGGTAVRSTNPSPHAFMTQAWCTQCMFALVPQAVPSGVSPVLEQWPATQTR